MLIFGVGILEEWLYYRGIIKSFYENSGLEISIQMSYLYKHEVIDDLLENLAVILPYHIEEDDQGFKYLGYF